MMHVSSLCFLAYYPPLPQRASCDLDILAADAERLIAAQKGCKSRDLARLNDAFLRILISDLRHRGGDGAALPLTCDQLCDIAVHEFGLDPGGADHDTAYTIRRAFKRDTAREPQKARFGSAVGGVVLPPDRGRGRADIENPSPFPPDHAR